MVKAKFKCAWVREHDEEHKVVSLEAVTNDSEENKSFSKYTPSGSVEMVISNESSASEFFIEGKEYKLTFEESE